ncbi:MAG: hypothetical protein AAB320_08045 [Elusimicrobiota bacterium]
MPETIPLPRRRKWPALLQVTVAVFSGAAALYCIQQFPTGKTIPVVEAPKPSGPKLSSPGSPSLAHHPVASSMMVKAEPGGAPEGMLRAYGDDERGLTDKVRPGESQVRLKARPFGSEFAGGITRGFSKLDFAAPPERARPKAVVPDAKRGPRMIEKDDIPQKHLFVPSAHHPEDLPEPEFWTGVRVYRAVGSGLVAVIGCFFILFRSGLFQKKEEA